MAVVRRKSAKKSAKKAPTKKHRSNPDPFAARVGARIKGCRKEAGISFDAFVEEASLGRGYVSELERGLVVPTINVLAKVAGALEMTVADLVIGDTLREKVFDAARSLTDKQLEELLAQVTGTAVP